MRKDLLDSAPAIVTLIVHESASRGLFVGRFRGMSRPSVGGVELFLQILNLSRDGALAFFVGYGLEHFFHGGQMGDLESFGARRLDVGLAPGALPVGLGDWTYSSPGRHKDTEVFRDPAPASRIGPATGCLTDRCRALQVFQIVGELFRSREGPIRRQDIDGLT